MPNPIERALRGNEEWVKKTQESDPELFRKLGSGQEPKILWIGCSDSRVPETTLLGLKPGDVFVHRNIANVLLPTDLNSLSVIEYAVVYLKVEHIVVCGHTSCGGVAAALGNQKLGAIDVWLQPIRQARMRHWKELEALDPTERALKLVELNVHQSLDTVLANPNVIEAMNQRGLQVHGLIYNVGTGELKRMDINETEDTVIARKAAFEVHPPSPPAGKS